QVLHNLVDNAIKFTGEGGAVKVRIGVRGEDVAGETIGLSLLAPLRQYVEVAVTDTGIGIDPQLLPRVFEPFYQVDSGSTRAYGGTGLGLTIARRLTEAHGGRLEASSELGRG